MSLKNEIQNLTVVWERLGTLHFAWTKMKPSEVLELLSQIEINVGAVVDSLEQKADPDAH